MDYIYIGKLVRKTVYGLQVDIDKGTIRVHSLTHCKNLRPEVPRAKKETSTTVEKVDAPPATGPATPVMDVVIAGGPTASIGGVNAELLSAADQEALLAELSSDDLSRFYLTNESEGRRAHQRSLDLFEEGVAIVDIKEELLLKKVSERVKFINPPKLLQRQLHNVLLFVARPNITTQEVFSVPLEYLSWAVEHTVNGYGYLKESITEMQQSLMNISYNGHWVQTQILQDVQISPNNVMSFRIPPLLRKLYGAPERYYHVSMRMNARFRSKYAHALYELLVENQWRKQTGIMTVEEFRERMGIDKDEYKEYKRLAARVLMPALRELEELGDYYATVKPDYKARKVVGLNFIIHENAKNALQFEDANLDPECFTMLREEFGLNPKQITELTQSFEVRSIQEIADVLFYRYICRKKAVRNGFSLFKNALSDTEDKYFLTNTEKAELLLIKQRRKQEEQLRNLEDARAETQHSLVERFDAWWAALTPEQQQTTWDLFLDEPESDLVRKMRKGRKGTLPDLNINLVKSMLVNFAARTGQLPDKLPLEKPATFLAASQAQLAV
jgi:hypothetical protein